MFKKKNFPAKICLMIVLILPLKKAKNQHQILNNIQNKKDAPKDF